MQAHVCILTVGCKGGTQLRWWFGISFGALVDFRKIDGWVKCGAAWGALQGDGADAFCLIDGRVLFGEFFGGAFGGAGAQALLSGVYAGVFFNIN